MNNLEEQRAEIAGLRRMAARNDAVILGELEYIQIAQAELNRRRDAVLKQLANNNNAKLSIDRFAAEVELADMFDRLAKEIL